MPIRSLLCAVVIVIEAVLHDWELFWSFHLRNSGLKNHWQLVMDVLSPSLPMVPDSVARRTCTWYNAYGALLKF